MTFVQILYDKTKVSETDFSWEILFDPKYKENVLVKNDMRDMLGIALKVQGYSLNSTNEEELKKREFGNNGEFAIQFLHKYGAESVNNQRVIIADKLGDSLLNQTRVWLDKISPGISPKVTVNMKLRNSEVRYEYIEGKNKTNSYKSVNVGLGITYVLPIVVALLSAREGDMVIIENPEAHIHPAGQRK